MKLEVMITDDMIRDRIRRVRLAYGRDPNCVACGPHILEKLNNLYLAERIRTPSVYDGERLYGIPILVNPNLYHEELLFLMDIDQLQPAGDMEELGGLGAPLV